MRTPMLLSVLAVASVAISGCASGRYAKDLNRVKADVNLLDERVSQLERTGPSASSSTAWPDTISQPSIDSSRTRTAPLSVKPPKRDIQQALKNAGFYQGSIDGKFGPKSKEAVREFQRTNGLKVDGVVGRQTWEKLGPYLSMSGGTAELSTTPESVVK